MQTNQNLTIKQQECEGNYTFTSTIVVTQKFLWKFGKDALELTHMAVDKIIRTFKNPDYLQVLYYKGVTFWVIDDGIVVTCLLPEEY